MRPFFPIHFLRGVAVWCLRTLLMIVGLSISHRETLQAQPLAVASNADSTVSYDPARYLTIDECVALKGRLRDSVQSSAVFRDTLPWTLAEQWEPVTPHETAMIARCGAKFQPQVVPLKDWYFVTLVLLLSNRESEAQTLIQRRFSAIDEKTSSGIRERVRVSDSLFKLYVHEFRPPRLAAADSVMTVLLATPGVETWREQQVRALALHYIAHRYADTALARRTAFIVDSIGQTLTDADRRTVSYTDTARGQMFMALEYLDRTRALDTLRRGHLEAYFAMKRKNWVRASQESVDAFPFPMGNKAPVLQGTWFGQDGQPSEGPVTRPTPGAISLVVFVNAEMCWAMRQCRGAYAALRRLKAKFPELEVNLVAEHPPAWFGPLVVTEGQTEGAMYGKWLLGFHKIAGGVVVESPGFWRLPGLDRRAVMRSYANPGAYRGKLGVVNQAMAITETYIVDPTGYIIDWLPQGTSRESEPDIEAIVAALLRRSAPSAESTRSVAPQVVPPSTCPVVTDSTPALVDPALRTGTLPNGMRYYIRANKTPAKRAMLRLAVNVGSLHEDDDQQGFAHFLEHMAFNGTRTFPRNTLIDFVESVGMTFGGHLNAYTNFDETVYMLTVPTDKSKTFQQGLHILAEWANGGILNDSAEVVAERGVVLGEWRSRMMDTTAENGLRRQYAALLGDSSRYLKRFPIGKPALLESATPAPLKRFYKDWYRPDLMAIIVVGDVDVNMAERFITTHFGKIPPAAQRRVLPAAPLPGAAAYHVLKGAYDPNVMVLWRRLQPSRDPRTVMREAIIQRFMHQQVNRKFTEFRSVARRPFVIASLGIQNEVRALPEQLALNIIATPDSLVSGLAVAWTELERLAQHGIPSARLEREKNQLLRQLESQAAQATAYPSDHLADQYVQHYLTERGALLSPQQELTLAQEVVPTISSHDIAQAAAVWRDSAQRTVLFHFPTFSSARPPNPDEIAALADSIRKLTLTPLPDTANTTTDVLASTGNRAKPSPATIVAEQKHTVAGVVAWTLSNGVRVLYKSTSFNPDELIIHAKSQGGASRLPDSLFYGPGRLMAAVMTEAAGFGNATNSQVRDRLSNRLVREFRVGLSATDEEFVIRGSPRNLETLFQTLYLQWTAPTIDSNTLNRWKRVGMYSVEAYEDLNDQIARQLNPRNHRLAPLSPALVQLIRPEEILAVYRDRFGDASDFTFVIVGAAPIEQVRPLVLQYLGTLPSTRRTTYEQPVDPKVPPFEQLVRREVRSRSTLPRATTVLVFDGKFPSAPSDYLRQSYELQTLSQILNRRLRIRLREQLSATYGVGVSALVYVDPTQRYRFQVQFDAAPERINDLIPVVMTQLDSLRTVGVTREEVARARMIQQRQLENQLLNNNTWVARLLEYSRIGIPIDRIPTPFAKSLAPDVIQRAARQFLPTTSYLQYTVLPKEQKTNDSARTSGGGPSQ